MLNIILDYDVVLDLLAKSNNDTKHCFVRLQKTSIQFWISCCLLSLLENQLNTTKYEPLSELLTKNVHWLTSSSENWLKIPKTCESKTHAMISLDAATLSGTTIIWTKNPDFNSIHPDIESGDHELVYCMLAEID
ncbi:hypothetical protein QUF74_09325 [Candidatus Halobeggiatoa sp. HSG11]|nr:hypothetical protein [Candidatus Halobeggiatoa sp. HSG11]